MAAVRGKFITFEGIEGVGKSTQVRRLAEWLREGKRHVLETREPGGAPTAEAIRTVLKESEAGTVPPESELLLIFAARAAHVQTLLRPALENGRWVVCDRFVDASYAYQGAGRGLGAARVAELAAWIVPDLMPDLTLVLDLPVSEALARMRGRGERDRFEQEADGFFRRVRDCYLARAAAEPERMRVIDASGEPAEVAARCRAAVREQWPAEFPA